MKLALADRRDSARPLPAGWPVPDLLLRLTAAIGGPDWIAGLVLVEDGAMSGLNLAYRDVEGTTDVLSFSYLLSEAEGTPDLVAPQAYVRRNLWLDPLEAGGPNGEEGPLVGEVVLAPGFVAERCREQGWPLAEEVALLVVHGCLHLVGWEHDRETDRVAMRRAEADLLAEAGIPHPLQRTEI